MIVCVAVVGQQNNPLYIQIFTETDDSLKLHHIVHCSLDGVDERVNNPKKYDTFLGLLYLTENYKVYGYLTNTKVKFILVTADLDVKDANVRNFFRRFHACGCSFKSFSRAGQENHFQNLCRDGGQHCQGIWAESFLVNRPFLRQCGSEMLFLMELVVET